MVRGPGDGRLTARSGSSIVVVDAAVDNTTVTLEPPVAGAQIQLAQVGDWFEFGTAESFEATGNQPFLLVQYMSGCYNVIDGTGQPSDEGLR